ncbi:MULTISPECIES: ClpX C4-type zinc finger protein [unclassified Bradyrhizobium]|uniref:ClpX C4-type zinc finger protein n=1 Tax=unclassified Bradyrhizobium TaxID=2631580 RepID=UPI0003F97F32|nr:MULTISPECIES: ClpX C4-type zinc finger protein [unclassified Bradyrhizobium]QIG93865.1 hypothetical protein G6P99_16135 [Bradyrhizobium sp. 6(2017)]
MDLQTIIQAARRISGRSGFITFDQLNELCPKGLSADDVEALLGALKSEGIRLADHEEEASTGPSCSFCGKAAPQVLQLVAGPKAFICNECVQLCVQVFAADHPEWLAEHRKFVEGLPSKP